MFIFFRSIKALGGFSQIHLLMICFIHIYINELKLISARLELDLDIMERGLI